MNKTRRERLRNITQILESEIADIEAIIEEEEEYMENIPENLQESVRYYDAEDAIDNMNEAVNSISESIDSLQKIFD